MIRVTIELLPGGFGPPQHLHTIDIWNDGQESSRTGKRYGSYGYHIGRKSKKHGTRPGGPGLRGEVKHFPRLRKNAVQLLREVLNDAYGKD